MAQILIVDDDANLARQLARHLQGVGHECTTEQTAEGALACLDRGPVDLVVLDVMLPGLSGFELCRRIRASAGHFMVPILMISAMASREEMAHGLAQGADDFLGKPSPMQTLQERAERLLHANSHNGLHDDLTELAGAKRIKLEMQRAISRRNAFATVYAELLNIAQFGRAAGSEARAKTVRHFGRALHRVGLETNSETFRVGHLGGGHFLCLVAPDKVRAFCTTVEKLWDSHLPRLYSELGREKLYRDALESRAKNPNKPAPLLDVLLCVTVRANKSQTGVQEVFETLGHLRRGALAANASGTYFDRRQTGS